MDLEEEIVKIREDLVKTGSDFKEAIKDVEPSALREIYVEIPAVTWEEVGGLEEVKDRLEGICGMASYST